MPARHQLLPPSYYKLVLLDPITPGGMFFQATIKPFDIILEKKPDLFYIDCLFHIWSLSVNQMDRAFVALLKLARSRK